MAQQTAQYQTRMQTQEWREPTSRTMSEEEYRLTQALRAPRGWNGREER